uniref:Uncharacterized protein n=1 Tax=Klebsiella pneumoniae TaxID=573 RepID=A0A6M4NWP4_KLEPN|nr:hypothetical protein [Klebsiella pneumoniae]
MGFCVLIIVTQSHVDLCMLLCYVILTFSDCVIMIFRDKSFFICVSFSDCVIIF